MEYDIQVQAAGAGVGVVSGLVYLAGLVHLAIVILLIASFWKIFTKAGQPGWASLIPIYNLIVLMQVAGKPVWWIILMFIPLVNAIIAILVNISLAERFGKDKVVWGLLLSFLGIIFYPVLAFSDARYLGENA